MAKEETWKAPEYNPWLLQEPAGERDLHTHINAMELLGLRAIVWTLSEKVLQDREVLGYGFGECRLSTCMYFISFYSIRG